MFHIGRNKLQAIFNVIKKFDPGLARDKTLLTISINWAGQSVPRMVRHQTLGPKLILQLL